ncbi:hypothetical protein HCH_06492 [Hahella chejuensis KCTC 2396]|uniref:Uncharacterized protein n=1 Tax=Hahella chejuensis (strain KCTC 2396) TaxID=349521 RepID=Q2S891_HAHCH|nr:hypothetical protein HCH_06492 [Hahella chejuensis KCTC 2396]
MAARRVGYLLGFMPLSPFCHLSTSMLLTSVNEAEYSTN